MVTKSGLVLGICVMCDVNEVLLARGCETRMSVEKSTPMAP